MKKKTCVYLDCNDYIGQSGIPTLTTIVPKKDETLFDVLLRAKKVNREQCILDMYEDEGFKNIPHNSDVLLKKYLKCCGLGDGESMWMLYEYKKGKYIDVLSKYLK